MSHNARVILDSLVENQRATRSPDTAIGEYFLLFVCDQVLKEYDLSYDDLTGGMVDGPSDGGVDAVYTVVDTELVTEDSSLESLKGAPSIELYLIQAKHAETFRENELSKVLATLSDILDLDRTLEELAAVYSASLLERIQLFRNAVTKLAPRHPQISITYIYATRGDSKEINKAFAHRLMSIEKRLANLFPDSTAVARLMGARELLDASRQQPSYSLQLRLLEGPIATDSGYVALARLTDYAAFISDDSGGLRKYIFEANVRDFQGNVEVNRAIRATLDEVEDRVDFWCLNNGVTIVASEGSIVGKTMTLDNVQVVNGLQTSRLIYETMRTKSLDDESRSLLLKIVITDDDETRDRIIKATNSQTSIQPASLRATDRIQRDIETFFIQNGWYYDRRKNYYKNLGKPVERIISIPYLAQAVMAIVLREPDNSRARPSTLIKRPEDYERVFNPDAPLQSYLVCARLMRHVERVISSEYSYEVRTNVRYHLAMLIAVGSLQRKDYGWKEVAALGDVAFDLSFGQMWLQYVLKSLVMYREKKRYPLDRIAKSSDFVEFLLQGV